MHRLFRAFLDQTQARLEEIRIAKVEEDTIYAELVFALGSEKIQLDAPISNCTDGADIFALALRFQSPIYVSQKSLNADVQPMVPMDRQTKHVVDLAREEAVRLGHCYLGTEHVLLGMIKDSEIGFDDGVGVAFGQRGQARQLFFDLASRLPFCRSWRP